MPPAKPPPTLRRDANIERGAERNMYVAKEIEVDIYIYREREIERATYALSPCPLEVWEPCRHQSKQQHCHHWQCLFARVGRGRLPGTTDPTTPQKNCLLVRGRRNCLLY